MSVIEQDRKPIEELLREKRLTGQGDVGTSLGEGTSNVNAESTSSTGEEDILSLEVNSERHCRVRAARCEVKRKIGKRGQLFIFGFPAWPLGLPLVSRSLARYSAMRIAQSMLISDMTVLQPISSRNSSLCR